MTAFSPGAESAERLYDGNFFLALVSQTCFVIANTLMAHYARWIEFLGGDLRQVGLIMGAGPLLGLVLRPWMAQWINRLGARTMWLTGYGVFAAGSMANLLIGDLGPAIFLIRASLIMGAAIVFASSLTYISQIAPPHRRTEAIGILGVGGFIGMLVGPFLGDLFLEPIGRTRSDFVTLFVVAAVANLIPAVLLSFMRPPAGNGMKTAIHLSEFFATVRRYWPGMILLVDLAFGVCMIAPFVFVASFIDVQPLRVNGVSVIGLFFWCYAGLGTVVRIAFRQLPDRIGRRKVLLVGMMFMSFGMLSFSLVDTDRSWLILVPALLTGTGHSLMFYTMCALTIEPFPREVHGTGSALALMMLDLGTIAGAPILGSIAQRYGFAVMFSSIGLFCLCTAIAYAWSSLRIHLRSDSGM